MSDQTVTQQNTPATTAPTPEAPLQVIENTLANFTRAADVKAVYGAPVYHGEVAVIPAAEVLCAMGFGAGGGSGNEEGKESGSGGGGGGGGRVLARPVAAIIIAGNTVHVEPVVDVTKIVLGLLTAAGFMASMWWRMSGKRGR